MASTLFAESLKSSLDIPAIDKYFQTDITGKTLEVLQVLRPEGRVDGDRFSLSSIQGGAGSSFNYSLSKHLWGDNATGQHRFGLVAFVSETMKCSSAEAVKFLVDKKFLNRKDAKKALSDAEGNPLVLPIPEEHQPWEYVLEQDVLRKDRGILKHYWTYRDIDGSLLGYKYRVDQRSLTKEVFTLTYRGETGWTKKAWQKKLIPPYGLEYLSQGPTVRVLFVEGEKAADAAREMLGIRWKVLSFSGVAASDDLWLPDEAFWEDCEVVLWPDNDGPGREAARKLQLKLENLQNKPREIRIVRVEAIAGLPPKWDLADWEEGCPVDVKVELERAETVDSFDRVCREWVYVTQPDQFHNLEDRGLIWSTVAFDKRYSRYADKTGTASKKFLSSLETKKVDDLEFVPGENTFVVTAGGKEFLNEWYPSAAYAEAKRIAADPNITNAEIEHNARELIAHLERVACGVVAEPDLDPETGAVIPGTENRLIQDALILYFSRLIRRPMDKQGWFPLLVSAHNGTGKSYFLNMVQAVLGGNRCATVTVRTYVGQYDDWRDGLLFYELGEMKSQDSTEVYEELKKNHNNKPFDFAKSGDRTTGSTKLNIKTRGMKNQRDFLNGFATANDLFPIAMTSSTVGEVSDRRLLVQRCEQILTNAEATALFNELQDRPEWIGAWLMRFKPAHKWNPSWAPVTEHKRAMFEKDRERAEARSDRYELGKYDQFFHYIQWARGGEVGAMARKVVTGDRVRSLCEERKISYPWQEKKFDQILERAGFPKGPELRVDGVLCKLYAVDPTMVGKPDKAWREELSKSHEGPL